MGIKMIKIRMKSCFCIGVSICIFFMYSYSFCLKVYANKDDYIIEKVIDANVNIVGENVFTGEKGEDNNIGKKINDEISNDTGLLDTNVENYLNENGVFDEELKDISDIKNLNNIEPENIQVFTGYFAVSDTKEDEGIPVTDEELVMLDSKEVDSLLGNIYYDEENEIIKNKVSHKSLSEKVLMSIGLKPVDVYAWSESKGGGSVTYLKKTLMAYSWKIDGEECVRIIYSTVWTTMPEYRNIDVVSLYWTNATYENFLEEYVLVEQYCDYKKVHCYDGINGKNKQVAEERELGPIFFDYYPNPMDLKKSQYFITSHGIVCAVKLHEDSDDRLCFEQRVFTQKLYTNENIIMSMYLQKEANKRDMTLYPYYQHYKSGLKVNNIISGIINAGFSLSSENYVQAVYELVGGLRTTSNMDFSGVTWAPKYKYSFK